MSVGPSKGNYEQFWNLAAYPSFLVRSMTPAILAFLQVCPKMVRNLIDFSLSKGLSPCILFEDKFARRCLFGTQEST